MLLDVMPLDEKIQESRMKENFTYGLMRRQRRRENQILSFTLQLYLGQVTDNFMSVVKLIV